MGAGGAPSSKFSSDPGIYAYIPSRTGAVSGFENILVLNTTTGTVDHVVSAGSTSMLGPRLIRFGDFLIQVAIFGSSGNSQYYSRNVITNVSASNGSFPIGTYDCAKFGSDKLAVMYVTGQNVRVVTYTVSSGILSQIADLSLDTMTDFRNNFSSPQFAPQITLDANATLSSYSGRIALSCVYSYIGGGASTVTYYGIFNLNSAGTSLSSVTNFTNSNNFSRPTAAAGDGGYCLVGTMDMGSAYVIGSSSFPSATSAGGTRYTNYAPAAIHGSSGEFMIDSYSNAVYQITTAGVSTSFSLPTTPTYGTLTQTTKGGCTLVYCDPNSSNAAFYRTYSRATNTWSSALSISGYPTINLNIGGSYGVKKVINY